MIKLSAFYLRSEWPSRVCDGVMRQTVRTGGREDEVEGMQVLKIRSGRGIGDGCEMERAIRASRYCSKRTGIVEEYGGPP